MKIKSENSDSRLDVFLYEQHPETSRSLWQKKIISGQVLVNGVIVKSHYKLKDGDKVEINPGINPGQESQSGDEGVVGTGPRPVPDLFKKIVIIKKTKDYLVINKPAGLAVHGNDHNDEITLVDWLLKKYPTIRKIGDDPARPGIVHRLDKDVNGLMVIALTQDSFDDLKKQFQKRTIVKKYLALVYGVISRDESEINFKIERAKVGYKMAAKPISQTGRVATTIFKVLKRFVNYTLVEAQIKTGRTHQIRAHFSAYNHPLVGDNLYANRVFKEKNNKLNLGRVFLTAVYLAFTDLKGEQQEFNLELPKELDVMIGGIR